MALPPHLLRWLLDREEGSLTTADLGVLVTLLLAFEGREPIFVGSHFEGDALVCTGPVESLRFAPNVNPRPEGADFFSSGWCREPIALQLLALNGWFEVKQGGGGVTIRLGASATAEP